MMKLKRLTAYSDKISLFPGEKIEFKVSSTEEGEEYHARLVRIIHGDTNPDGPGYREEYHASAIEGSYRARHQPIRHGSYGRVDPNVNFARIGSFTFQAIVMPTLPAKGNQTIVSLWDPQARQGFQLGLGSLA